VKNPFYFDDRVLAFLCALAVLLVFWGVADYDLRNPPCTECAWKTRPIEKPAPKLKKKCIAFAGKMFVSVRCPESKS
jgi:hypothetical protein